MLDFSKIIEQFQGNAYPAMVDTLARDLGVSSDALREFGIGWAPVVTFKKGPNYQGWWAYPERQADGTVCGITLRSTKGTKVMYPGSKHGLVFPLNPNHELGGESYQAGPHNWVRTAEVSHLCPVCGKPDGCLLSAENPEDPRAVVCIRVPSQRPLRFGHLHVRKPEGAIDRSAHVLAASDRPVLVVEGMTDAAAAWGLGFVAVGRPSNMACLDQAADLLRGRSVVVVGENDPINPQTGQSPGREGMIAAFQMLKGAARTIKMVLPPEEYKDLRTWVTRCQITAEDLLQHIEEHGQDASHTTVLPDDRPLTVARQYLMDCYRMAGRYTLRRWLTSWVEYDGSRYRPLAPEALESPLYRWAHDKQVQKQTAKAVTLVPIRCDNGFVSNTLRAVQAETLIDTQQVPAWVNGATGPNPRDLIPMANGILDSKLFLTQRDEDPLMPHTPDFFSLSAIPHNFNPTAKCPTWQRFLLSSLGDDYAKIKLLQEWFGYCLVADTSMQKMMYLRGPSAAGKSVVLNTLRELVGETQAASTSFSDLVGPFGLSPLMGKLVVTVPDARDADNASKIRGLEVLLNIAGNDFVTINRKYKDPIESHRMLCRITIASNRFLQVPDHEGAMLRRLNVIDFTRSFVGREDVTLEERIRAEIPGIIIWALHGLGRLRSGGRFTVPESSTQALKEWRTSTSPMAAFLDEACEHQEDGEVSRQDFYDAWTQWSRERGMRPLMKTRVFEQLRANAPYTQMITREKNGSKQTLVRGLVFRAWAKKALLGKISP